jgi:hypothetical protein
MISSFQFFSFPSGGMVFFFSNFKNEIFISNFKNVFLKSFQNFLGGINKIFQLFSISPGGVAIF